MGIKVSDQAVGANDEYPGVTEVVFRLSEPASEAFQGALGEAINERNVSYRSIDANSVSFNVDGDADAAFLKGVLEASIGDVEDVLR
jgi:hypothetical protein